jgi:ABC-type dipeptide/oligopeptide/nickel transport system ATPase component
VKRTILWIVGEPGVGKTTLARGLLGKVPAEVRIPKPKWSISGGIAAAGHYVGGTFDGADTVPYNGVEDALVFWREFIKSPLTLLDGDRFSNAKVVEFLAAHNKLCLLLSAPEDVVAARRAARGSDQNPSWVRGRKTKSRRFFEMFPEQDRFELAAGSSPTELLVDANRWLKGKTQ